ncbi:MAG TPA: sigma factor [Amycolatopsis sp.]|nr:sigma factor [Amycolatopsis sp.]
MSSRFPRSGLTAEQEDGRLAETGRWELVWARRKRLLKAAERYSLGRHEAEDIVTEVLLRAMTCPDLDETRIDAWLTAVTARLCVDHLRARSREPRRWARAGVPGSVTSCEDRVCDQDEARWIAARVAALPRRQERALRLRANGMDVAGVAGELGVSYRTAESLLARGRRAARALLASAVALPAALAAWPARWVVPAKLVAASSAGAVTAAALVVFPPAPAGQSPGGSAVPHAGTTVAGSRRPDVKPAATRSPVSQHKAVQPAEPPSAVPSGSAARGQSPDSQGPTGLAGVLPGVPGLDGVLQSVPAVPGLASAVRTGPVGTVLGGIAKAPRVAESAVSTSDLGLIRPTDTAPNR